MDKNTIKEYDILRDKSEQYLEERLESDDYGLTGDLGEIRGAFSDGCLFTVELAQKIIEEMFSSFTMGETAKCLALEFRDRLFSDIKSNKISLQQQ